MKKYEPASEQERITLLTLPNIIIYVENGKLHIEAWDTSYNVSTIHNEIGTGYIHTAITLTKEDIEKIALTVLQKENR